MFSGASSFNGDILCGMSLMSLTWKECLGMPLRSMVIFQPGMSLMLRNEGDVLSID